MKKPAQKRSKAQEIASRKWAAAGRAKEAAVRAKYRASHHGRNPPRTKAQQAATRKWQRASVAAAAARRQGKTFQKAKARAAFAPPEFLPDQRGFPSWLNCNEIYPVCAAAAVANSLLFQTGYRVSDKDILMMHRLAGGSESGSAIEDVLEAISEPGISWPWRLEKFWRADHDLIVPGLVTGMQLGHGSHAVLSHANGMVTWGSVLPWTGVIEEAWALEWAEDLRYCMGIGHFFQAVFGFRNGDGNSPEYLFWSGAGSDLAYLTFVAAAIGYLRANNCHVKRCPRIGRHEFTEPDTGTKRKLCWRHHPEVSTRQMTRERLHLYLGDKPGKG